MDRGGRARGDEHIGLIRVPDHFFRVGHRFAILDKKRNILGYGLLHYGMKALIWHSSALIQVENNGLLIIPVGGGESVLNVHGMGAGGGGGGGP